MHVGMRLLAAAVVSAAAAATAAAPLAGDKSKSSPPNIMWMHVESTDGRLYNDDSPVPIPHIRSVQKRGVNFVNFYANVPICCPSRASVWSKLTPPATHTRARPLSRPRAPAQLVRVSRSLAALKRGRARRARMRR